MYTPDNPTQFNDETSRCTTRRPRRHAIIHSHYSTFVNTCTAGSYRICTW